MVNTTHGMRPKWALREVRGGFENDNERTSWVEYYDGDELVHRSVDIVLKQGIEALAKEAALG